MLYKHYPPGMIINKYDDKKIYIRNTLACPDIDIKKGIDFMA